ncbi:hypothetical protein [Foetidibacter luteolus]|uniref:hypothetical protein n=1 Tax=Foetidibacter luteolus TaxID=2608880 RepID=UPI00129B87E5|nr:hypothetical protein [Foetidibacter luteolus]
MEFALKEGNMDLITLQLLIQIRALQETQLAMMIELLSKDDKEANENMAWMNRVLTDNIQRVLEDLYTKHGELNIKELFDNK